MLVSRIFLVKWPEFIPYRQPVTTSLSVPKSLSARTAAGDLILAKAKEGEKVFDAEKSLNRAILNAAEDLDRSSIQRDGGKTLDLVDLTTRHKARELLELISRIKGPDSRGFTTFARENHWYRHLPQHLRSGNTFEELLVSANGKSGSAMNVESLVEFTTELISAMIQAEAWAMRDARHRKSRTMQQEAAQA